MKQKILLLGLLLLFASPGYSQNSTERYISNVPSVPTNIERYKIDYELVDEIHLTEDSLILNQLNLENAENFRLENEIFIHRDENTHLKIRLYPINHRTKNLEYTNSFSND